MTGLILEFGAMHLMCLDLTSVEGYLLADVMAFPVPA